MQNNFHLLYPPDYDKNKEVPMKDFKFIQALKIDTMVVLIKESYRGFSDLKLENFFTTDEEVLKYRLDIVEDLVENPTLYKVFCNSLPLIYNIHDLRRVLTSDFTVDSALSSVRYLEMYLEIVKLFANAFSSCSFSSEGMKNFKAEIDEITRSSEFQSLDKELSQMECNFGHIKSVTIGLNLDENLRPKEAGILSVNEELFRPGTIMDRLLKRDSWDDKCMMSPLYPLTKGLHGEELRAMNHSMNYALYTIFSKSLRDFEPLTQNYYCEKTALFLSLLDDIRFLTAGVGFILEMKKKGFSMCKPRVAHMEEKKCDLKQVYNPSLAMESDG